MCFFHSPPPTNTPTMPPNTSSALPSPVSSAPQSTGVVEFLLTCLLVALFGNARSGCYREPGLFFTYFLCLLPWGRSQGAVEYLIDMVQTLPSSNPD
ncbi:hypothetical protein E2C01_078501 [Portunus trituberculatus]|uniref:Uncharacterized protein n=1 Tax=Portunus trituberculatus TaxID=210409 RepID=A0A5B7IN18_PORTR|nr:hypothetical protein [Portunus trituberculatus]